VQPSAQLACPPRFATQRDESRQTLGPQIAKTGRLLGQPFMPWQDYVGDVIGEIDPVTGELYYDEFVIEVPRQSGKTTLIKGKVVHRCSATKFFGPRQHVVYTAQTRNKAREKFEEDIVPDLQAGAFASRMKPHWGNGNEHIRFQNGSRWGIEANTEKAGHGGTLDAADIDEAFAHVDDRHEQAFEPAMLTRKSTQLGVISTAGWLGKSPYLWTKTETGRLHIVEGSPRRLAYFEWSAHEDDDPGDEDVWWRTMPALGITVSIEAMRSRYRKAVEQGKLNGFRRAYLNQWVEQDEAGELKIDPASWAALEHKGAVRPKPVTLAVAVSEDRKWSCICLAGKLPDGRVHLQVVKTAKGTHWVVPELSRLHRKWGAGWVAVAAGSPAASLIGAIETAKLPLLRLSKVELAAGCGMFADGVENGSIAHTMQPVVTKAIGAAGEVRTANKTWLWQAVDETDISPLWGLTCALFALGKPPKRQRTGKVATVR
jgi:phage terminase large subunit-like protein